MKAPPPTWWPTAANATDATAERRGGRHGLSQARRLALIPSGFRDGCVPAGSDGGGGQKNLKTRDEKRNAAAAVHGPRFEGWGPLSGGVVGVPVWQRLKGLPDWQLRRGAYFHAYFGRLFVPLFPKPPSSRAVFWL